jgi:chromosome partitioning related protein ParA
MIYSIVSTKGGVGKTTATANLAALIATAGKKVLVIDLDPQPTMTSYYDLDYEAPGGIYELIVLSELDHEKIISKTNISGLDLIKSNDSQNQLQHMLLNAPDGRFRLSALLKKLITESQYDLILMDTQGARSVLLESAVLASDHVISPITPELLSAREFVRGTCGLLRDLEPITEYTNLTVPHVSVLINRLDDTSDAREIASQIAEMFSDKTQGVSVLNSVLRASISFRNSATQGRPIHIVEPKRPSGRKTLSGATQLGLLACELFPAWENDIRSSVLIEEV